MFEAGAYTLGSRMFTVLYKAVQFGFIGFAAGLAGTYMSSGLISLRKALDPSFTTQNELPPTVPNAACWALHMSVSSNLRYQVSADRRKGRSAHCSHTP